MNYPIYQLTPDTLLESFDDGALVLSLKDVSMTELNITARDVLSLTDGVRNLQEVAEHLAADYEIEPKDALQDISELYHQLAAQGILESIQLPDEKGE